MYVVSITFNIKGVRHCEVHCAVREVIVDIKVQLRVTYRGDSGKRNHMSLKLISELISSS